jgi:rhamnosyltransferase subunit B
MFFSAVDPPRLRGLSSRAPAWWNRLVYRTAERLYLDRVSCPAINALRLPAGLPAMRRITDWWHSPDCILGMFPAWFAAPQPDWPPQVRLTEFPLWDDGRLSTLPDDVMRFLESGDPPIVITPGSANPCDRTFWTTVVMASRQLRRRAMLLSRFSQSIPDNLPSGVQHFQYASFAQLLPRAAAIVHHGGIGTTAQALAAGIPQVIQPFSHDQPDNANRVSRLGVGRTIPRKRFTANRLASELDSLLNDAAVAARCREIAGRIQRVDPFAQSCEVLCELAERRESAAPRPVVKTG